MGQINTNNYPTVNNLADADLLIVENATNGTGTTTPKQLRENAIGTDTLQTTSQTVTGAINELKRRIDEGGGGLPEDPLSITHGGTGNSVGYIQTGRSTQSALGTGATIEGDNNTGAGAYCHAEGHDNSCGTNASYSHVEGQSNNVSGTASHAEGYACNVSGNYSHAGGYYNTVGYQNQTAVGKYNNNKSGTLFEVGNGTSTSARNNAFEVYSDGKSSWDNGATKFKFTQNNGADGYYDASGTFHAFASGGGTTIVKTRYTITYSNWSATVNSDGYYTYSVSLSPTLYTAVAPNVYIAGSTDSTAPTDTEKSMFAYVNRCRLAGYSSLTLYAKTKPTSTFYIYVEGVNGLGSGNVEGNVIQPNGVVSGENPFSNLTPFFYSKSLKSNLVARSDNKGYNADSGATGWSATLTTAQINQLNNSNCVLAKIYANDGFGLQEISDIFILPKSPNQKAWYAYYQSGINELYWAQILSVNGFWSQYGTVSNDAYATMNNGDEAFAIEYYIIA